MSGDTGSSSSSSDDETTNFSPYLVDYEELLKDFLTPFIECARGYGGLVRSHALLLQKACVCLSKYLFTVADRQVDMRHPVIVLAQRALVKSLKDVGDFYKVKEHTRWSSHLAAIAEASQFVSWAADAAPLARCAVATSSFNMYSRYVKRMFAGESRTATFVKSLSTLVRELHGYVARWHLNGTDVGSKTAASVAAGTPLVAAAPAAAAAAGGAAADDFYDEVIIPRKDSPGPDSSAGPTAAASASPAEPRWTRAFAPFQPVKANTSAVGTLNMTLNLSMAMLSGTKPDMSRVGDEVTIENQHTRGDLVVEGGEATCLYIRNCHSCTISVRAPQITYVLVEESNKVQLTLDSVTAGIEVSNARAVVITVPGPVGYVDVDRSAEVVITLGAAALESVHVFTAAAVDCRVARLDTGALVETAIPFRFRTTFVDGKFQSEPVYVAKERRTTQGLAVIRELLVSKAPLPDAHARL